MPSLSGLRPPTTSPPSRYRAAPAALRSRALVGHLETVGIAKARQTVLVGPAATRSAAESRLRRLGQSLVSADTVWFVFAGPAFAEDGRGFLACADTLADDRAATALAVA